MKAIFNSDLSEHAKLIRIFLESCANDNNKVSSSVNNIAEKCSVSRATVKRALKELEQKAWLTKIHRISQDGNHISNMYILHNGHTSIP